MTIKTFISDIYIDLIILLALGIYAFHEPHGTFFYFISLFLTIASMAFWVMSRMHLGNSFSVSPQAVGLVRGGIYSKIRHPMYFFSCLALLFIVLYLNSLIGYALLAVLVLIQLERIHKEDAILEEHFGAEYAAYKEKTWF